MFPGNRTFLREGSFTKYTETLQVKETLVVQVSKL